MLRKFAMDRTPRLREFASHSISRCAAHRHWLKHLSGPADGSAAAQPAVIAPNWSRIRSLLVARNAQLRIHPAGANRADAARPRADDYQNRVRQPPRVSALATLQVFPD